MDFWKEKFKYIFVQHKYKTTWRAIATFMAAVVVFVTTYGMILPAITMETEIADEMPGIQLEHNAEPEQTVEDDLSDGLTGGSEIPETSVEPQDSEGIAGQDIAAADDGKDEAPGAALLTAKTEKSEAVISNVSGEMFPAGMSLTINELKKEGFEYNAYRPIAQNKASSDEEEPGDWSDCDTRIFDLRFIDKEGYEVILPQEMKAEIKFTEPMTADLYKVVLLTDERDDLTGDADTIDVDSVKSRNNHTLELIQDGYNAVIGFRFKAEEISLVALLTKQAEAEPEIETTEEPEEEITADETVTELETETEPAEETSTEPETETETAEETVTEPETEIEPAEETTTESETEEESTDDTEENPETDEVQEEETELDEAVNSNEETEQEEETEESEVEEETEAAVEDQEGESAEETEEATDKEDAEDTEESVDNADDQDDQKEETDDSEETVDKEEAEETDDTVDEEEAKETDDTTDEQEVEESAEDAVGEEAEESEDTADEEETEESKDAAEEQEVEESEEATDEEEAEESEDTVDEEAEDTTDEETEDTEDEEETVEEDEESAQAETEQPEEDLSLTYPEKEFIEETEYVHVYVKAGVGAFPAGTTMEIDDVDIDDDTFAAIEEAVEQNVSKVRAVNITFFDVDGNEIEPAIPVQVIIKAEESTKDEEIKVVHVDDDGVAKEVETVKPEALEERDGEAQATIIEPGTGEETQETSSTGLDDTEDTKDQETDRTENTNDQTAGSETESEDSTGGVVITPEEQTASTTDNSDSHAAEISTTPEESTADETENTDTQNTASASETVTENPTIRMTRTLRSPAVNSTPANNTAETEIQVDSSVASESIFSGSDDSTELVSFYAGGFSIYALVYTVDFHWEVDGKEYKFDLTGGGAVSLRELVEVLHIVKEDTDVEDSQTADEQPDEEDINPVDTSATGETISQIDKFISDIENVRFSNESLVKVAQITEDTTAGQLKENLGLQPEYSAELTEEKIAEMDAKAFRAPDWVLISMKAFNTEEYLTVMMKTGEVFTIKVTDAQIKKTVISASGETYEITVTYDNSAEIPDGTELRVTEIAEEDEAYNKLQEDILNNPIEDAEDIPAHPVLFNISLWYENQEIEPAEGSTVRVEIKLVKDIVKGMYTDEDSPLIVNDAPVNDEISEIEQTFRIIHQVEEGRLELMETTDTISEEEVVSEFVTDSFSNWLLYLDEDLDEITVYKGDSLTLRPYGEWYWKKNSEPDNLQSLEWLFPLDEYDVNTDWKPVVINYNNDTENRWGITQATTKDGKFTFSGSPKYDRELKEDYWFYHCGLESVGDFNLHIGNDKVIKVHVLDQEHSDKPDVVTTNISNIKVNLFDYDRSGDLDEGWKNGQKNKNLANSVFDQSINTWGPLKFLSSGSGNASNGTGLNDYTNQYAHPGLVSNSLVSGYPALSSGESLAYLFNENQTEWTNDGALRAYPGVEGLFQIDSEGYYYYNSNSNYAYYDPNTGRIVLYEHTYTQDTSGSNGVNAKPIGFFPFHDYDSNNDLSVNQNSNLNHHFGMSLKVPFALPSDKLLENGNHIIYEFSGDDDLWVYIDNTLVLDIGGIHQPVRGFIDFTDGKVYVYNANDPDGSAAQVIPFVKNLEPGVEHTLSMFYMERGGCDSNLSVKFNIPVIVGKADIRIAKEQEKEEPDAQDVLLNDAVFGLWDTPDCSGDPLKTATSNGSGENAGVALFQDVPIKEIRHISGELSEQVYYLKEIKAPDGYYVNDTIYKLTAVEEEDADGHFSFVMKVKDDENAQIDKTVSQIPIVYDKKANPFGLTVEKKWAGEIPENASATFQLKRYKSYEGYLQNQPDYSTLKVYRVDRSWSNPELLTERQYVANTSVSIQWQYGSTYGWQKNQYRVDNSETLWGNPATVIMPRSGEISVYIFDGNKGTQYDSYGVQRNVVTSGQETAEGTTQHVSVVNEYDSDYNDSNIPDEAIVTLDSSSGWTYTFPPQRACSTRQDNIIEYYTYYIEEIDCTPSGYLVSYDAMNGNQIAGSSESETRIITNYKNEVYVEKRWYGMDGEKLDPQPATQVTTELSSTNGGNITGETSKNIIAGTPGVWNVEDDADKLYTAVEDPVPQGFTASYTFKDADETTERDSGGVHRGGTIYINNTQNAIPITVKKLTKNTTNPLAGAEFTLTKVNDENHPTVGEDSYSSGSRPVDEITGIVEFEFIKPGRYELEETKIPNGYVKKEGPYYFILAENGQITLAEDYSMISAEDNEVTFVIENEPGPALPSTGGPGTKLFYLLGCFLSVGAGMILLLRKRRRI